MTDPLAMAVAQIERQKEDRLDRALAIQVIMRRKMDVGCMDLSASEEELAALRVEVEESRAIGKEGACGT